MSASACQGKRDDDDENVICISDSEPSDLEAGEANAEQKTADAANQHSCEKSESGNSSAPKKSLSVVQFREYLSSCFEKGVQSICWKRDPKLTVKEVDAHWVTFWTAWKQDIKCASSFPDLKDMVDQVTRNFDLPQDSSEEVRKLKNELCGFQDSSYAAMDSERLQEYVLACRNFLLNAYPKTYEKARVAKVRDPVDWLRRKAPARNSQAATSCRRPRKRKVQVQLGQDPAAVEAGRGYERAEEEGADQHEEERGQPAASNAEVCDVGIRRLESGSTKYYAYWDVLKRYRRRFQQVQFRLGTYDSRLEAYHGRRKALRELVGSQAEADEVFREEEKRWKKGKGGRAKGAALAAGGGASDEKKNEREEASEENEERKKGGASNEGEKEEEEGGAREKEGGGKRRGRQGMLPPNIKRKIVDALGKEKAEQIFRREEEGLLEMGRKDPRSSSKDETQGLEGKGKEEDEEEDGKAGGDGDRPRTQEVEMKEERAEDKQEARNASSGGQREQRGGGAGCGAPAAPSGGASRPGLPQGESKVAGPQLNPAPAPPSQPPSTTAPPATRPAAGPPLVPAAAGMDALRKLLVGAKVHDRGKVQMAVGWFESMGLESIEELKEAKMEQRFVQHLQLLEGRAAIVLYRIQDYAAAGDGAGVASNSRLHSLPASPLVCEGWRLGPA